LFREERQDNILHSEAYEKHCSYAPDSAALEKKQFS
jgi:hypothetical protein